jgi:rhomboid protease GluP
MALVGINCAIFLAMGMTGASMTSPSGQTLVRWGANYGPLTYGGDWWRLITYNFLHSGFLHIGFNMWCLWDLGALCESLYGTWTFGALYLICGVAGGLASTGLNPARLTVGASGAIFGLAGALIAGYYLGEFALPQIMIRARLRSVVLFVIFNVVLGTVGQTDNICHLGGLVAGLICGALIAKLAPSDADVSGRVAILAAAVLLLGGTTAALERSRGAMIHAQRGMEFLHDNNADEAIPELQTAVRMRPDDVTARLNLADAYYVKGQYGQAEFELKQALARDPQNLPASFLLGFVYLAEKHPDQAKDLFAKLVKQRPDSADAHYGLGMALAAGGDDRQALGEYATTIRLRPQFEGVYYRVGLSQTKLKQYDDAIASFQKEQEIGDDPDTENALADAYQAKGMKAEADEARKKAEAMRK